MAIGSVADDASEMDPPVDEEDDELEINWSAGLTAKNVVIGIVTLLGVVTILWHLYYAWQSPMTRQQHSNIHLGLLLTIFYLITLELEPEDKWDHIHNGITLALTFAVIGISAYVHFHFDRFLGEVSQVLLYTDTDLVVGGLIMLIAIHATWRAYGRILGLFVSAALFYGYAGFLFPGILGHGGFSVERLIFENSISLDGVYGFILGVGATWVAIFIFFAGFIEGYGGIDYLIEKAEAVSGTIKSGVVQTAVVSSMLVGSVMGSSAANVATTGSFTIPLMKDQNVEAKDAGAIESIASTAGQMLPPVMGSAAFLMADIIGISFFEVIRGATIPALLFYGTTVTIVYLMAIKHDWGVTESKEQESETDTPAVDRREKFRSYGFSIFEGAPYLVAFLYLLYLLAVLRATPLTAGLYAILVVPPLALVRDLALDGTSRETVLNWLGDTVRSCRIAAVNMAPLTAVLASLGIVVRVITQTGLAQKISFELNVLAGGTLLIVLLVAMFISILFGMGMPTAAAYIVVAILTAPTLVQAGLEELTAHMFVFYFAMLSTITLPVALSCAVAAGIAKSTFWDVSIQTLRLGVFAFLLPFTFVFNEELIVWTTATPFTTFAVMIGLVAMAIGIVGYDSRGALPYWVRVLYFGIAGVIFFVPVVQLPLATAMTVWLGFLIQFKQSPVTSIRLAIRQ